MAIALGHSCLHFLGVRHFQITFTWSPGISLLCIDSRFLLAQCSSGCRLRLCICLFHVRIAILSLPRLNIMVVPRIFLFDAPCAHALPFLFGVRTTYMHAPKLVCLFTYIYEHWMCTNLAFSLVLSQCPPLVGEYNSCQRRRPCSNKNCCMTSDCSRWISHTLHVYATSVMSTATLPVGWRVCGNDYSVREVLHSV